MDSVTFQPADVRDALAQVAKGCNSRFQEGMIEKTPKSFEDTTPGALWMLGSLWRLRGRGCLLGRLGSSGPWMGWGWLRFCRARRQLLGCVTTVGENALCFWWFSNLARSSNPTKLWRPSDRTLRRGVCPTP